jgi:hypothetical protein
MSKTKIQFTINLDYWFTADNCELKGTTTHYFKADVDMNNHIDVYKAIEAEVANLNNNEYLRFKRNNSNEFEWNVEDSNDTYEARVNLIKFRENSKFGEIRYINDNDNSQVFKYKVDARTLQEVTA